MLIHQLNQLLLPLLHVIDIRIIFTMWLDRHNSHFSHQHPLLMLLVDLLHHRHLSPCEMTAMALEPFYSCFFLFLFFYLYLSVVFWYSMLYTSTSGIFHVINTCWPSKSHAQQPTKPKTKRKKNKQTKNHHLVPPSCFFIVFTQVYCQLCKCKSLSLYFSLSLFFKI